MGYNACNDEIRDNITRMRQEWEAQHGALATVRRFNAFCKGLCLVLAQDCSRANFKTSLACHCVRQLRDGGRRATLKNPSVSRSVKCNARAATATVGRASLLWRGMSRFKKRVLSHTKSQ